MDRSHGSEAYTDHEVAPHPVPYDYRQPPIYEAQSVRASVTYDQPVRLFKTRPEHDPGVIYVLDRGEDYSPYYSVVCRCGWFAEPVDSPYPDHEIERQMAAAALAHDPNADTSVAFPLDDPTRR